jgi:hypothetical protein
MGNAARPKNKNIVCVIASSDQENEVGLIKIE